MDGVSSLKLGWSPRQGIYDEVYYVNQKVLDIFSFKFRKLV